MIDKICALFFGLISCSGLVTKKLHHEQKPFQEDGTISIHGFMNAFVQDTTDNTIKSAITLKAKHFEDLKRLENNIIIYSSPKDYSVHFKMPENCEQCSVFLDVVLPEDTKVRTFGQTGNIFVGHNKGTIEHQSQGKSDVNARTFVLWNEGTVKQTIKISDDNQK